jgi:hypothetical protein
MLRDSMPGAIASQPGDVTGTGGGADEIGAGVACEPRLQPTAIRMKMTSRKRDILLVVLLPFAGF